MTNELTVRVEHPELPAIRWNEAEVQDVYKRQAGCVGKRKALQERAH